MYLYLLAALKSIHILIPVGLGGSDFVWPLRSRNGIPSDASSYVRNPVDCCYGKEDDIESVTVEALCLYER